MNFAATSTISIKKLTPNIGATLSNVDLSQTLSDADINTIHQALLDHKVIFFRDQDISTEQHLAFGARFGELEIHPFAPHKPDYPEILAITHDRENPGKENAWHSDVTWRQQPSLGSILRAIELPETGGDTLFANMEKAYDDLSDDLKQQLEGKIAFHDFAPFRRRMEKAGASEEQIKAFNEKYPPAHHPVIRTHPDTGGKSIYVNVAFTQHIEGIDKEASDQLLGQLWATAAKPEYQCRFAWQPNSIAFWDNRACQHYAVSDYWPNRRVMERVTVIGDTPA